MTATDVPPPPHECGISSEATAARTRALAEAVGDNVVRLRGNSGIDLATLAEWSGLPRDLLRAIEAGEVVPTLRAFWALAKAFAIPFGVLLSGAPSAHTTFHVLRAGRGAVVDSAGGGFRSRALSAAGDPREPEVYEVTLAPSWREEAGAHAAETFEHIVVVRGALAVAAGDMHATLTAGDVVFFRADRPHVYANPGTEETLLHLTMTYAGDWLDDSDG